VRNAGVQVGQETSVGLSFSSASCVWQPHEAELKLSPTDGVAPDLNPDVLGDD